jgi:O-antigen biosynthesis protein WbqP
MLKRLIDLVLIVIAVPLALPLGVGVALAILATDGQPIFYWSQRVGRHNRLFWMPKFRTMRRDTPAVATHLLTDPQAALTPVGGFLRMSSLDEIPQLFSVLRGDMTIVGPRPALFNQDDLVTLRTSHGLDDLVPGITGWAQVNGRDDLSVQQKVEYDRYYHQHRSSILDMRVIYLTIRNVIRRDGVHH